MSKNNFYTYAWLREDGTPYYIGKGIGNRAYRIHKRSNIHMSPPSRDRVLFLKKNLTEFDAYKHENYIITILGLKSEGGILINMSYGGEGSFGRTPTDYCIERTKQTNTGKKLSEEHKKKVSEQVSQRKWWNNGIIDKHCIECPGVEWKLGRLFNTNSEKYKSKEFREKCKQNNLGKVVSKETKELQSKVRKGRKWWNNGEKTKLCYECPGEGWIQGRPGTLLKVSNKSPKDQFL
jgi:hypothetical protein